MRNTIRAAILVLALLPFLHGCLDADAGAIGAKQLRGHVDRLASDEMAGRETGEAGIEQAEAYIAREFERYGLEPLPGQKSFFAGYELYREGFDMAGTIVRTGAGDASKRWEAGADFRPFGFSDAGERTANVVFAGYGISAPEANYDDYAGLDVTGRFVLVLRHAPGESDPSKEVVGLDGDHALFQTKANTAQERGAAGMILVTDPLNHIDNEDLRIGGTLSLVPPEESPVDAESPFLAVHVSRALARELIRPAGFGLEQLQTAVDGGERPAAFDLGPASMTVAVEPIREARLVAARNVVGIVEGSDPELRHEWILVGAHHDHLGRFGGEGDTVFNGADDNASGTTGVLALARAIASAEVKPRRSIVFATFSGEEKGLLGSRALVRDEVVPLDRLTFMLNLDMIGRNSGEAVQVFGDGYVRGLREVVERANRTAGLDLAFAGAGYAGNSDHDPFYREDIPFMFFFTGTHEDYHQLSDHAELLDYARMQQILTVARGVLVELGDADESASFIHRIGWLGTTVERQETGAGPAAVVTAVDAGSRAEEFGLRGGDAIVAIGELPVDDPSEIGAAFRTVEPGTETVLVVRRGDERQTLDVRRARTGYMGVFPGAVDEDRRATHGLAPDEGLLLRQVTADGPSAAAGLQQGDIVIRMAGQVVGPSTLRGVLSQIGAGETIDVTLIRDGERMTMPMMLGARP